MLSELNQLCDWTGMRRLTELRELHPWKSLHNSGCAVKVDLAVDGRRTHYELNFARDQGRLKIWKFLPQDYEWHGVGLGFDTLKDPAARAFAVAAVKKVNQHLRWKWV